MLRECLGVVRPAELFGNDLHGLELPVEVTGQVDALVLVGIGLPRARDLIIHATGIGAVPYRQAVSIRVICKPSVKILFQPLVVAGAQPLVVVPVLFRSQHRELRQKRLEHLPRPRVFDPDGARNEAIRLLPVKKHLEVNEVVRAHAVVGEIHILEVEIPVVKLAVCVAGQHFAVGFWEIVQPFGRDVAVQRLQPGGEFLKVRLADERFQRIGIPVHAPVRIRGSIGEETGDAKHG